MGTILTHSVETWENFMDMAYERNWTDGMPIFPPLESKVEEMIRYIGRDPEEEIGEIPPKRGVGTIAKLAANAVMAGCKPEYLPVVIAALEAMLDPKFNLQGVNTTTHPCEPLTIVSGPLVKELAMRTNETVWAGAGARANVAIGRAVRLVMWNIGGSYPNEPCKKPLGHPGRFCFLIPEDNVNSPWEPIHVERGLNPDETGVTVFGCEAPHNVGVFFGTDMSPNLMSYTIADTMSALGNNNTHTMGETLVVLGPKVAKNYADAGWSKQDVKVNLFEKARRKLSDLRPRSPKHPDNSPEHWYTWWPKWVDQTNDETMVPSISSPESIHLIVSGANSVPWASVCPGWGEYGGFAVTRSVKVPHR